MRHPNYCQIGQKDYQMTQNLIGNLVEADAVIDLIKQKLSTVDQHVVNIAKKTLSLLDFFSLAVISHHIYLRNTLIINMRYIMAQKSDEVRSRIGVLFPVQAEFVRGYCGQICISSPAVGKKFQFTAGSFPEFIDQYYGRVIFALIRLRLACVTPK